MRAQNQYLYYLIDLGFQGANRLFVFMSEDNVVRSKQRGHFLPKVEI